LLSKFDPTRIVVVASRTYSSAAATKFAQITGASVLGGRFIPGRFTNVARADFVEPTALIICDPKGEHQAVIEAGKMGVPTVGLCDTDNFTTFIDWVIPCNNKGRRSLSLIFWLLAREIAISNGKIGSYDDFKPTLEEFEAQEVAKEAAPAAAEGAVEAPISPAPEATAAPAKPKIAAEPTAIEAAVEEGESDVDEEEDGPEHQAGASIDPPSEKGGEESAKEKAEKKEKLAKKKAAPKKAAEKKAE
jgi:small subunit ribosomal protein S2